MQQNYLQSDLMPLSAAERSWLPWFGKTGKLAMGWACWLNKSRYPIMEQAFESIASTRIKLLHQYNKRKYTMPYAYTNSVLTLKQKNEHFVFVLFPHLT